MPKKRILVIDDDPLFRTITQKGAGDYDFSVDTVSSIRAFKKAALSDYCGFIIDYDLDDGTGDEILELLHQNGSPQPVALISSTNHATEAFPMHILHPYTFVSKWQPVSSFFAEVQRVLIAGTPNKN